MVVSAAAHTFDPSSWEAGAGGSLEFQASLDYRDSSRMVRAAQGNCLKQIKHYK